MQVGEYDFGRCCACQRREGDFGAVLMLPLKAPVPGTGWGCSQCGLAADGAFVVLCSDCMDAGRRPVEAVCGYLSNSTRMPISELVGRHEHDIRKHPEVMERRVRDFEAGQREVDEFTLKSAAEAGIKGIEDVRRAAENRRKPPGTY